MAKFIFLSLLFVAVIAVTALVAVTHSFYLLCYGVWVGASLLFAAVEPINKNAPWFDH